jgi:hypothetical protein
MLPSAATSVDYSALDCTRGIALITETFFRAIFSLVRALCRVQLLAVLSVHVASCNRANRGPLRQYGR